MRVNSCSGGFPVKEDNYLFGKRTDAKSWYEGVWDLFGGFAITGENPEQTLQRELHEELGITIRKYKLLTTVELIDKEADSQSITIYMWLRLRTVYRIFEMRNIHKYTGSPGLSWTPCHWLLQNTCILLTSG